MITTKKTIIITGASSGIGRMLAIKYSLRGQRLFLIARSKERLEQVAEICRANGSEVDIIIASVANEQEMKKHISEILESNKIDIVIACAGVSAGTLDGPETAQQTNKIFTTNINGVLNSILPIIPHMIKMRSGNIVIVSSMAGFVGLSSAPSYSASKGAVRIFGDALRGYLKNYGIFVTNVIPGYVKTPMTDVNNFPMPFMITAERAADKIISGIDKNKNTIAFPLTMFFLMKMLSLVPSSLMSYINSKLPGKPAFDEKIEE